jgi:RNA polymerase sigma-70 factor (ECF subfamily)
MYGPVEPEVDDQPEVAPFEAFYRAQYPGMYAFILRRLDGSREDVADVTAEVFATAWRRVAQVPPPPEDRLWLYGVASRVLSRHHRGAWRRHRLLGRLQAEATVRPVVTVVGAEGDGDRVRAAMARLREADREVLALVLWERLNHGEVAELLGCSANAVAIRLHRARARLRRLLEEEEEDR